MNWIYATWPWYISGPAIAFIMFLLLMVGKNFGMSSNLKTLCTLCGAGRSTNFFKFNWKTQKWNLLVALGAVLGGFIASCFMTPNLAVTLNPDTVTNLKTLGINSANSAYMPVELFGDAVFQSPKNILILVLGGLCIGFGARYAGGCTSGHAISGLSNLQRPSLIAVIGFFIGGLVMVHFIYPFIF